MKNQASAATACAILAAALYAINIPLSKLLLTRVRPTMLASWLYLGAGLGMLFSALLRAAVGHPAIREPLTRRELPDTVAMVVLDIAAPILLMFGIARSGSAQASLLNNFEIVATALLALLLFREVISRRLWLAIGLITAASLLLVWEAGARWRFNSGSLLVLAACLCWGFENNCTRRLSGKSAQEVVIIKGCCSGLGSLAIAWALGEPLPASGWLGLILLLGFVSYGLSINFYILAQKDLGAAKTSAYYSLSPFLGVGFSLLLLGERPRPLFYLALAVMTVATLLLARDTVALQHTHAHTHVHTHAHAHGGLVHSHEHSHTHSHIHTHGGDESLHTHAHTDLNDHQHSHSGSGCRYPDSISAPE